MQIEKNIPIPEATRLRQGKYAECAKAMEKGDSVKFEKMQQAVQLQNYLRKAGKRGTIRKESATCVRVWCTEVNG